MKIPIPQIAAVAVALAALAGLLVFSPRLRIRPWVVLLAGAAGLVMALLVNLFLHRTYSLGSLVAGVLLICAAGALLSLMASLVSQWFFHGRPPRELRVSRALRSTIGVGAAQEAPLDGLMHAQDSELALLNGRKPARPALTLVKPEAEEKPETRGEMDKGAPEPEAGAAEAPDGTAKEPEAAQSPDEELERLEEGFRLEQERLEREEEKRRARERAAQERKERREEERRMKEEQQRQASEAQRVRERIREERERVALEEKKKLEAEQAAAAQAPQAKAEPPAATEEENWQREEERLARELAQRKAEQEKAAQAEQEWLAEQKRLAEAEEKRREAERLEREEAERLAKEEAERLAQEEAERLAKEEAERFAREEAERLEAERLERERAERERREALEKRVTEALEHLRRGEELAAGGAHIEALPWLEKAARLETTNDLRLQAGLAIVETLVALGWKGEALKKMQAIHSELETDAAARKRLGELAAKLLR